MKKLIYSFAVGLAIVSTTACTTESVNDIEAQQNFEIQSGSSGSGASGGSGRPNSMRSSS
nr:hypothetical protein [Allomuricauda sp.]